jgi:nucleotide-binding universal stress UspA family protein
MKVLVAYDGTLHAENALEEVLARPWPSGSKFYLLTVAEPLHVAVDSSFGDLGTLALQAQLALDNDLKEALKKCEGQLVAKFGRESVTALLVEGNAPDEIINKAKEWNVDLIAIGSHGENGFNEGWLGSVAHAVMQRSSCSVEILRGLSPFEMESKVEKNEPLEESRYLIAVKEGDNPDKVVEAVLARDWAAESRFRIVTVVEPTIRDLFANDVKNAELKKVAGQLHEAKKERAELFLKLLADRLIAKFGKNKVTYHVLDGNARAMILQIADDWPADMIFLSAHKDKNILEYFLGSVAQAVVVNAECSVELVRA